MRAADGLETGEWEVGELKMFRCWLGESRIRDESIRGRAQRGAAERVWTCAEDGGWM